MKHSKHFMYQTWDDDCIIREQIEKEMEDILDNVWKYIDRNGRVQFIIPLEMVYYWESLERMIVNSKMFRLFNMEDYYKMQKEDRAIIRHLDAFPLAFYHLAETIKHKPVAWDNRKDED